MNLFRPFRSVLKLKKYTFLPYKSYVEDVFKKFLNSIPVSDPNSFKRISYLINSINNNEHRLLSYSITFFNHQEYNKRLELSTFFLKKLEKINYTKFKNTNVLLSCLLSFQKIINLLDEENLKICYNICIKIINQLFDMEMKLNSMTIILKISKIFPQMDFTKIIQKMESKIKYNSIDYTLHDFRYFLKEFYYNYKLTANFENISIINKILTNENFLYFYKAEIEFSRQDESLIEDLYFFIYSLSIKSELYIEPLLNNFRKFLWEYSQDHFIKLIKSICMGNLLKEPEIYDLIVQRLKNDVNLAKLNLKEIAIILRSFASKENDLNKKIGPNVEIIQLLVNYSKASILSIDPETAASFLASLSTINLQHDFIDLLFDKIENSIELMTIESLTKIPRIAGIYKNYSEKLWSPLIKKNFELYDSELPLFLKGDLLCGLFALKTEANELFKKFGIEDQFNIIKETYLEENLNKLREYFSKKLIVSKIDFYFLLKALGFKIIPEATVEVFSIDFLVEKIDLSNKINKLDDLTRIFSEMRAQNKINKGKINKDDIPPFELDKEKCILIEIHGPTHYVEDNILKGGSELKERLLRRSGYKLMVISHQECEELSKEVTNRAVFLNLIDKFLKID